MLFKLKFVPTIIPSITQSGSLLPVIELPPLTLITVPAPGAPFTCVTCTPEALPCKAWSTLATGNAVKSSELTEATEPVKSDFRCVP